MKSIILYMFSTLMTIGFLSSCGATGSLTQERINAMKKSGIVVVESQDAKPRYTKIGTTAFNNHAEVIHDSGYSFAEYMVSRLREKGYKCSKSSTRNHESMLLLYPTYPYQLPGMTGVGFHRRSFLSMSGSVVAFCNFRASIVDSSTNTHRDQPINFGDKGYKFRATSVYKEANSWSDFSPSEKETLRQELRQYMDEQADLIISQLGL